MEDKKRSSLFAEEERYTDLEAGERIEALKQYYGLTQLMQQTVIGHFGFDRSIYGNKKNIGPRKWRWLQGLRQERENDIRTEVIQRLINHLVLT